MPVNITLKIEKKILVNNCNPGHNILELYNILV